MTRYYGLTPAELPELRTTSKPTPSRSSRVHVRHFTPGTEPPPLRHPLELRALDA